MAGSTWYDFVNDTGNNTELIDADEVNKNFEWSEGNILPHNSGSTVNNTYDLGSATYKWKDVHIAGDIKATQEHIVSFVVNTSPYTATAIASWLSPYAGSITRVDTYSIDNPTGTSATVDYLGVDIDVGWTTCLAATFKISSTAYQTKTGTDLTNTTVNTGTIISVNIDTVGDTIAGGNPLYVNVHMNVTT